MLSLGHLDYAVLPTFLAHLDVGIVTFRMEEMNRYTAPNKLWAYLAMGLPVVSTDYLDPADKEIFADSDEKRQQRRAFALIHSAEQRAATRATIIQAAMPRCG